MRVLIVSAWNPTSGVLTVYRNLARHLGAHGVRYSAYAFDGWSPDSDWTFCDDLIDGRRVTLSEVLSGGDYDLLHCVDTTYSPPYGVEKWTQRARFRGPIVLMASVARRELTGPTHATAYIACSESAAAALQQDASRPVQVIPNGYDESTFYPADIEAPSRPVLGWVGRSFDPQKDVGLFMDAVERLHDFDAELAGQHSNSKPLTGHSAGTFDRVRQLAGLGAEEMAGFYRRVGASGGALVSTSRYEGFPLAIAEAMACRCPVVAPRIPGHEHLKDGVNAVMYDRAEGVKGIQRALRRLAEPAVRNAIIEAAEHEARDNWASAQMAMAYLAVYHQAMAERDSGRRLSDWSMRAFWRAALRLRPAILRVSRRKARIDEPQR